MGFSGFEFELFLNKHNIEIELSDLQNVLLFVTIGTEKQDVKSLLKVLRSVKKKSGGVAKMIPFPVAGKQVYSPNDAFNLNYKIKLLDKTVNKVSWVVVAPYPPGISVLAPGMEISQEAINFIHIMENKGGMIQGAIMRGNKVYVRVVDDLQ